jgi:hypothetical protein
LTSPQERNAQGPHSHTGRGGGQGHIGGGRVVVYKIHRRRRIQGIRRAKELLKTASPKVINILELKLVV